MDQTPSVYPNVKLASLKHLQRIRNLNAERKFALDDPRIAVEVAAMDVTNRSVDSSRQIADGMPSVCRNVIVGNIRDLAVLV